MNCVGTETLELVARGDFCEFVNYDEIGARSQDLDELFEPAGVWSKSVQPSLEVTTFVNQVRFRFDCSSNFVRLTGQ